MRIKSENRHDTGQCTNAITVDVEDYFQVAALQPQFPRKTWEEIPRRVESSVDLILSTFADYNVRGTFFCLAWIAERHPEMIRRIIDNGHEIASHGYDHTLLTQMTRQEAAEDLQKSKAILENLSGQEVIGYRAPTFSINRSNLFIYEEILGAGYRYSSSIYPIEHDLYGIPDAPRWAHDALPGLVEIPVTTLRYFGRNFPCAGGGYFRLFPYPFYRQLLQRFLRQEGRPAIFYTHPWEFDPAQPRPTGVNRKSKFRHYLNLDKTSVRLEHLVRDFNWGRMDEVFANSMSAGG